MIDQKKLTDLLMPLLIEKGELYLKFKPVLAVRVNSQRVVTTKTSTGVETENVAEKGDYVVQNLTEAKEQYVLKSPKFKQLYKKSEETVDGKKVYIPKGKVHAIRVDEELCKIFNVGQKFEILAPWGHPQIIRFGDYLVSPPGYHEFYGIAGKEFKETYRLKRKKKHT